MSKGKKGNSSVYHSGSTDIITTYGLLIHSNGKWKVRSSDSSGGGGSSGRSHSEQICYNSLMYDSKDIILLVQNEFPCEDKCMEFFKRQKNKIIFAVYGNGIYGKEYGVDVDGLDKTARHYFFIENGYYVLQPGYLFSIPPNWGKLPDPRDEHNLSGFPGFPGY